MANFYDVPVYRRKRFAYLLKNLSFWRHRALSLIELGSTVYTTALQDCQKSKQYIRFYWQSTTRTASQGLLK